mgnify:FL=1
MTYIDPTTKKVNKQEYAKVIAHRIIDSIHDDDGKPLFTDADVELINEMNPDIVESLDQAIDEFNGEDSGKK